MRLDNDVCMVYLVIYIVLMLLIFNSNLQLMVTNGGWNRIRMVPCPRNTSREGKVMLKTKSRISNKNSDLHVVKQYVLCKAADCQLDHNMYYCYMSVSTSRVWSSANCRMFCIVLCHILQLICFLDSELIEKKLENKDHTDFESENCLYTIYATQSYRGPCN